MCWSHPFNTISWNRLCLSGCFTCRLFQVVCFSNNWLWKMSLSPLSLPEWQKLKDTWRSCYSRQFPCNACSSVVASLMWAELLEGDWRLFPFFAALKSGSAALRMNSKQFHAIKCHCKHIRWEMFSFLLHRCTTLSCSLESCGVNLTHSCNIRFKNRTIKLWSTNYTILLPAC